MSESSSISSKKKGKGRHHHKNTDKNNSISIPSQDIDRNLKFKSIWVDFKNRILLKVTIRNMKQLQIYDSSTRKLTLFKKSLYFNKMKVIHEWRRIVREILHRYYMKSIQSIEYQSPVKNWSILLNTAMHYIQITQKAQAFREFHQNQFLVEILKNWKLVCIKLKFTRDMCFDFWFNVAEKAIKANRIRMRQQAIQSNKIYQKWKKFNSILTLHKSHDIFVAAKRRFDLQRKFERFAFNVNESNKRELFKAGKRWLEKREIWRKLTVKALVQISIQNCKKMKRQDAVAERFRHFKDKYILFKRKQNLENARIKLNKTIQSNMLRNYIRKWNERMHIVKYSNMFVKSHFNGVLRDVSKHIQNEAAKTIQNAFIQFQHRTRENNLILFKAFMNWRGISSNLTNNMIETVPELNLIMRSPFNRPLDIFKPEIDIKLDVFEDLINMKYENNMILAEEVGLEVGEMIDDVIFIPKKYPMLSNIENFENVEIPLETSSYDIDFDFSDLVNPLQMVNHLINIKSRENIPINEKLLNQVTKQTKLQKFDDIVKFDVDAMNRISQIKLPSVIKCTAFDENDLFVEEYLPDFDAVNDIVLQTVDSLHAARYLCIFSLNQRSLNTFDRSFDTAILNMIRHNFVFKFDIMQFNVDLFNTDLLDTINFSTALTDTVRKVAFSAVNSNIQCLEESLIYHEQEIEEESEEESFISDQLEENEEETMISREEESFISFDPEKYDESFISRQLNNESIISNQHEKEEKSIVPYQLNYEEESIISTSLTYTIRNVVLSAVNSNLQYIDESFISCQEKSLIPYQLTEEQESIISTYLTKSVINVALLAVNTNIKCLDESLIPREQEESFITDQPENEEEESIISHQHESEEESFISREHENVFESFIAAQQKDKEKSLISHQQENEEESIVDVPLRTKIPVPSFVTDVERLNLLSEDSDSDGLNTHGSSIVFDNKDDLFEQKRDMSVPCEDDLDMQWIMNGVDLSLTAQIIATSNSIPTNTFNMIFFAQVEDEEELSMSDAEFLFEDDDDDEDALTVDPASTGDNKSFADPTLTADPTSSTDPTSNDSAFAMISVPITSPDSKPKVLEENSFKSGPAEVNLPPVTVFEPPSSPEPTKPLFVFDYSYFSAEMFKYEDSINRVFENFTNIIFDYNMEEIPEEEEEEEKEQIAEIAEEEAQEIPKEEEEEEENVERSEFDQYILNDMDNVLVSALNIMFGASNDATEEKKEKKKEKENKDDIKEILEKELNFDALLSSIQFVDADQQDYIPEQAIPDEEEDEEEKDDHEYNIPDQMLLEELNLDALLFDVFREPGNSDNEEAAPNTTELEPFIEEDSEEEYETLFGPPPKTHASSSTDIDISIADAYQNNEENLDDLISHALNEAIIDAAQDYAYRYIEAFKSKH